MAPPLVLDPELARLYARALIAIARADDEISLEEGLRLQQQLAARCREPIEIAELLLDDPLTPEALACAVGLDAGPFRGQVIHAGQLAQLLVSDALAVVLAKGSIASAEATALRAFAAALAVSEADLRALTAPVARWLPTDDA